jgi:hypothetical protein
VRINEFTQSCALPVTGAPVVRAHEGTRASSVVEARAASATRARLGAEDCAAFGWRTPSPTATASLAGKRSGAEPVSAGTAVEAPAGHEAVPTVSKPGLKRVVSLAGVGLEAPRPVAFTGGVDRLAGSPAPLSALTHRGSNRQPMQQDQFGTNGAGTVGYAAGTATPSTSQIDPRDFRTSSPPG